MVSTSVSVLSSRLLCLNSGISWTWYGDIMGGEGACIKLDGGDC